MPLAPVLESEEVLDHADGAQTDPDQEDWEQQTRIMMNVYFYQNFIVN